LIILDSLTIRQSIAKNQDAKNERRSFRDWEPWVLAGGDFHLICIRLPCLLSEFEKVTDRFAFSGGEWQIHLFDYQGGV